MWKDETFQGDPLKKVLIIGVDRSPTTRKLLENEFVRQLKGAGTTALASYDIFPEEEVIEKEMIESRVSELGIDSFLIARLIDVNEAGTYETYPTFYAQERGFYGYYIQCCQIVSLGNNVVIETKIFDAKYDKLIWEAYSDTVFGRSRDYAIQSFISAIIQDLQRERLLYNEKGSQKGH